MEQEQELKQTLISLLLHVYREVKMIIAFKDNFDGFYQCEVKDKNTVPEWAKNLIKISEEERQKILLASQAQEEIK